MRHCQRCQMCQPSTGSGAGAAEPEDDRESQRAARVVCRPPQPTVHGSLGLGLPGRLPGHGPRTTIGRERVTNPYLLELGGGDAFAAPARGL